MVADAVYLACASFRNVIESEIPIHKFPSKMHVHNVTSQLEFLHCIQAKWYKYDYGFSRAVLRIWTDADSLRHQGICKFVWDLSMCLSAPAISFYRRDRTL